MASFVEGFLTGFMRDQTEVIRKRKDDAENYFNSQMELARTRGLKNRDLTKQVMDGNLQIARQLEQVGVPKDLIMSVAKQNPDDLSGVLKTIQELQMNGVNPDESFYRDLIQVSKDYKAPDEDLSTFMTNLYRPLKANASSSPEGTVNDSLWATMFGSNAMDRSRNKLDETIVADGMTAGDLLSYSDTPMPNTTGAPSVVLDASMIGDETRAAKERLRGTSPLTPSEITSINNTYDEIIGQARVKVLDAWMKAHPEVENPSESEIPGFTELVERVAAEKILEIYRPEDLSQIPRIYKYLAGDEEGTDTGSVEPPAETPPPVVPEAAPAVEETPVKPLKPLPAGVPQTLPDGSFFYDVADDGTIIFIGPDGVAKRYSRKTFGLDKPPVDIDEILRNPTGN